VIFGTLQGCRHRFAHILGLHFYSCRLHPIRLSCSARAYSCIFLFYLHFSPLASFPPPFFPPPLHRDQKPPAVFPYSRDSLRDTQSATGEWGAGGTDAGNVVMTGNAARARTGTSRPPTHGSRYADDSKHYRALQALYNIASTHSPESPEYPAPEDLCTERFLSSLSLVGGTGLPVPPFLGFQGSGFIYIYICMFGDTGLSPVPLLYATKTRHMNESLHTYE